MTYLHILVLSGPEQTVGKYSCVSRSQVQQPQDLPCKPQAYPMSIHNLEGQQQKFHFVLVLRLQTRPNGIQRCPSENPVVHFFSFLRAKATIAEGNSSENSVSISSFPRFNHLGLGELAGLATLLQVLFHISKPEFKTHIS